MRRAAFPEINLSPQVLLDYDHVDQGCHGGDYSSAFQYIKDNGISEESCSNYRAQGYEEKFANIQPLCKDCYHGKCFVPEKFHKFTISDFGHVPFDEQTILSEIYQRGPISCSVNSDPIDNVERGFTGVFTTNVKGESNHAISLTGFGTDKATGLKYWIMRNSWGEYWADEGFLKVERGVNMINIEDDCWFAVPKNTWEAQYPDPLQNLPQSPFNKL